MTISTEAFLAINVGASANDGTGDSLRAAFIKINDNFSNISDIGFDAGNINVSGSVEIAGNITIGGAKIETGYQQSKPTANVAVTINSNVNRLLLHPTGTIISFGANVTLPGGNVDGTTFSISSNVATTLAVYGQVGTSVSPGANVQLTAGTSVSYLYYATDTKWYKIS